MKKHSIFIIIFAFILIISLAILVVLRPYVKTIYLDEDKKIWRKTIYMFGNKVNEEMANVTDKKKPYHMIISWNSKNEIKSLKSIYVNTKGKKKSFISYYNPGVIVTINNRNLIKQKQNLQKTYHNKVPFKMGDKFIYSDGQGNILFQENYNPDNIYVSDIALYKDNYIDQLKSDTNGDKKFDTWTYYKNGLQSFSEYDSDDDGQPDKKGVFPLGDKYRVDYKMGGGAR